MPHSDIHGSKPARGSPWLFAACHVLHRLLVPRHPPNALLLLEIAPVFLRVHHARKPSTAFQPYILPRAADRSPSTHYQFSHSPLITRRPDKGANPASRPDQTSGQTLHLNDGGRTQRSSCEPPPSCSYTRPGTHQNLIHTDKDHAAPKDSSSRTTIRPDAQRQTQTTARKPWLLCDDLAGFFPPSNTRITWWR